MMDRVDLRAWLGKSRALDDARMPVVAYRVRCDDAPAFAFTDAASASAVADAGAGGAALEPAYLRIERPFVESPDDATVGVQHLLDAIGAEATRRIVRDLAEHVEGTGTFEPYRSRFGSPAEMAAQTASDDLGDLHIELAALLEHPLAIRLLKAAGFDGAIFGHGQQRHWVVFSEHQVQPAILTAWPFRPERDTPAPAPRAPALGAIRLAVRSMIGVEPASEGLGRIVVTTASALQQQLRAGALGFSERLLRASASASADLKALMRDQAARRKAALDAIGEVGAGAIVRKPGSDRWMIILPDASAAGHWRVQPFDEDGFSGHTSYARRAEAIEHAARVGYTLRDDLALDRLQDTPRFRRGLLAAELMQAHGAGEISMEELHRQLHEHDRLAAVLASVSDQHAQAVCDLQTGSIFLLADRIAEGHAAAVLLHELMHKHGRTALGYHGWGRLTGALRAWRKAPAGSAEHLIYMAADARARAASRGDVVLYDEELFSYAVEEAVLRGFKPSALAVEGSVERWLDDVESTLRGVLSQLTQKPQEPLSGQQLVDLAYAISQMENPGRAALLQQRMGGSFAHVLAQAEALARSARRQQRASGAKPPVRLTNQAVGAAVSAMLVHAPDDLRAVLFNWNGSELTDAGDIVAYPGRDRAFSRGAEGGRVRVGKREFLEWLASEGPFDEEHYGHEIAADAEWRGQVERLRQIGFPQGMLRPEPAAPRKSLRPVSATEHKLLRQRGEPVASLLDAQRRFSDGERLFVFHEMEETPSEVTSVLDLAGYVADQVVALPAPEAPRLTDQPSFKAWFGDWEHPHAHSSKYPKDKPQVSAAVRDDGTPRVMFHASNGDFDIFETARPTVNSTTFGPVQTERHAIFAAPEASYAEEHLRDAPGGNVMPVYLDVKSPADLREGVPGTIIAEIVARTSLCHSDFWHMKPTDTWQLFDGDFGRQVVSALKDAGYDGAILTEVSHNRQSEHEVWAAFAPTQVKSAIGNSGGFDPLDPDIRHSLPANVDAGDLHYAHWKQVEANLNHTFPVKLRLEPRFDPSAVELWSIDSLAQGSGAGSAVLHELTRLADVKGVTLQATVDPGANEERLTRWYAEFGFVLLDDQGRIERRPGAPVTRALPMSTSATPTPTPSVPRWLPAAVLATSESPAFREWFEDSVVVDAAGWPLPVFHGTTRSFARFSETRRGEKTGARDAQAGFFFAENPQAADQFTWEAGEPYGGNLMPVFLRLRHPMVVRELVLDGSNGTRAGLLMERARAAGHDGVIFEHSDMLGRKGRSFAVFSAEQIKSVTGNRGTWSRRSADIRLSVPSTTSGRRPVWWRPPADPQFQSWFRDSTVRRPVFHATEAEDVAAFDTRRGDLGSHFGTLEQALHVSRLRHSASDGRARIIPVWLQLRNPLRLKDEGSFHADGIALQLERKGMLAKGEGERIRGACDKDWTLRKMYDVRLRAVIQAAGFDGIVYRNRHEAEGGDSYIAFEPHQVRTAVDAWRPAPQVLAVHWYPDPGVQHPVRSTARALKVGDQRALDAAAAEMARLLPAGSSLVPIPSSRGEAGAALQLANRIAALTGAPVADILTSAPRASQYETKKQGRALAAEDMPMRLRAGCSVPAHAVLVDNVAGTGETLRAARSALGVHVPGLVYAAVPGLQHTHDVRMAPCAGPDRPAPAATGQPDDPFEFDTDAAFHHLFYGRPTAREVMEFGRWLRERPDAFVRLYHGTSARHPVLDQGLLPASTSRRNSLQTTSGYVCASVYQGHARQFGVMSSLNSGPDAQGYRVVVYPVVTTIRRLCADLDQLRKMRAAGVDCGNSLAESLVFGHGARMRGRLEPQALRAPRLYRTCRSDDQGEQLGHQPRERLAA